jgi:transcriptional regulator with XRE-family HTH domain
MDAVEKRKALGQFLRFCRERLSPKEAGIISGQRRRTAGLRREEVSELAGISTAWYTYLEQGRDVQASKEVLDSIAKALHLSEMECVYLYALAISMPFRPVEKDKVPASLQQFLDNLGMYPAYITGPAWDILAWNQAACRLFTDFGKMPKQKRNLVRYVFTDVELRRMYMDWEIHAQRLLAQFRMSFGLHTGDPRFVEIISELLEQSHEFAQWWMNRDVYAKVSGIKDLQHPKVGRIKVEYSTFQSNDNPRLTLTTYTAVDKTAERKLRKLSES